MRQMLADVEKAEALDPHTVRYTFKGSLVRDLPLTVAGLPIFSKAYYSTRDFAATTIDPPLGSGPYIVGNVKQGRTIEYKRNPNYWAKDLPVNRGRWNFDEIRYEYFRDRTAGMEAFKAGAYDFREEFTSKVWATEYDFPAISDGKVKKEVLPDETPSGTQGFFLNTRREQLKDPRVRQALDLAFDFEWANRNLFYKLYTRTQSYFENSTLKAKASLRQPSGACLRASACRFRRRRSAQPICRPSPTVRATIATICRRPASCSTRPAGTSRTACASTTRASRSSSRF